MDISTISVVTAATGVLIGVAIGVMELRNITKARQAELIMGIQHLYTDPEFLRRWSTIIFQRGWKDFDDWRKKYGPEANIEAFSLWVSMGNYYKGIGVLVNKNLIDIELVDNLISPSLIGYWEKCELIIKEFREHYKFPRTFEWSEYLYNEMQKREQRLQQTQR